MQQLPDDTVEQLGETCEHSFCLVAVALMDVVTTDQNMEDVLQL